MAREKNVDAGGFANHDDRDRERTYKNEHVQCPGDMLHEYLQKTYITQEQFATKTHIELAYLKRILAGEAVLSDQVCLRLFQYTGIPAWLWRRRDNQYQQVRVELSQAKRLAQAAQDASLTADLPEDNS